MERLSRFIYYTKDQMPIRLSRRLWNDLRRQDPYADIEVNMIQNFEPIRERLPEDRLPYNFSELVRLRKIAQRASNELVLLAERWKIERYCTVLGGSLARGVSRINGTSDVDIDLIVDNEISYELKQKVKQNMLARTNEFGTKIDVNIQDRRSIRASKGFQARIHLSECGRPIMNKGALWEEVVAIGRASATFISYDKRIKRNILRMLQFLSNGNFEEVKHALPFMSNSQK